MKKWKLGLAVFCGFAIGIVASKLDDKNAQVEAERRNSGLSDHGQRPPSGDKRMEVVYLRKDASEICTVIWQNPEETDQILVINEGTRIRRTLGRDTHDLLKRLRESIDLFDLEKVIEEREWLYDGDRFSVSIGPEAQARIFEFPLLSSPIPMVEVGGLSEEVESSSNSSSIQDPFAETKDRNDPTEQVQNEIAIMVYFQILRSVALSE